MKKRKNNEPDLFTNTDDVPATIEKTEPSTADQLIQQRNEMIKKMSKELKKNGKQQ
ncbi:MAG: hypothetical protein BWY70_01811 [Bacteroidetes bacterium ADurb.Bin408]|jgi:hypothetical protein|nr:hypothetical protein [Bacteroidales bacterium]OPZ96243.1 MAG: hypothetical protein BWY70_01811 [Bacteroidetes bacterium ADurb.Bin408]HPI31107.1 hypothetical protein [Bacteroidales bacterium]